MWWVENKHITVLLTPLWLDDNGGFLFMLIDDLWPKMTFMFTCHAS